MSLQNDIVLLSKLNLSNFRKIDKCKFNFRCPLCGDSKISKKKSRGYAIPHKSKDTIFIYCHNCNYTNTFYYFLKDLTNKGFIDQFILRKYALNLNRNDNYEQFVIDEDKSEYSLKENRYLLAVDRFNESSEIVKYLIERKIDEKFFKHIYFSINFKYLINHYFIKNKYAYENDIPRIVFPVYKHDSLIGFQGRSLYTYDAFRYMQIKLKQDVNLLYRNPLGIDKDKVVLITEGVFDCLILDNAVAMLGCSISNESLNEFKNVIFVYDNEKRNPQIVKKYMNVIEKENIGLFIWPKSIKYKDINEWAVNSKDDIQRIIMENSYFDKLQKKIKFSNWI